MREILHPDGLPAPLGRYHHVCLASGTMLLIAGQLSVDETGGVVGADDVATQVRQVYENLSRALAAGGAGWSDVAKFTTYLTDADHLPTFHAVRAELFDGHYPDGDEPPNTLVIVSRLVEPEFLVEIEALAVVEQPGM